MRSATPNPLALPRRALFAAVLLPLAPRLALAATNVPPGGRLSFVVFRNGAHIGEHVMSFARDGDMLNVTADVHMTVKLGPVTLYRYRHHAAERWAGDVFSSIATTTNANGAAKHVSARWTAAGVVIETGKATITAPASALPLTHWNAAALSHPLFNPQEGKITRVSASRGRGTATLNDGSAVQATCWSLRGDVEIDDFYDAGGAWLGLRGKLPDGSRMEYRRT